MGTGSIMIRASTTILHIVVARKTFYSSTQCPGVSGSQDFLIGVQPNNVIINAKSATAVTNAAVAQRLALTFLEFVLKMRV